MALVARLLLVLRELLAETHLASRFAEWFLHVVLFLHGLEVVVRGVDLLPSVVVVGGELIWDLARILWLSLVGVLLVVRLLLLLV